MSLNRRPDLTGPSGKMCPVLTGPSGHIHKHVPPPPQYHVTALRSCDMIFRLSGKNASSRSCIIVILLRLGCVIVGPWFMGPGPLPEVGRFCTEKCEI